MIAASVSAVAVDDRGLNYGDGLFETMLVADGEPVWWDAHLARLHRGCDALRIACPPSGVLLERARELARLRPRAALKIVLTRGSGGRGYEPRRDATPACVLSLHEAPRVRDGGASVRWCDLRISQQPLLAGLKHLNRLENVLARGEWASPAIAEGLIRDSEDRVICATAANVFIVRNGALATPSLERCGVAGIARSWVLARMGATVRALSQTDVESADELFLTSSLRGILPVARLGGRRWNIGPMTRRLQDMLWKEVPALEPAA
jgi:4-amino-4-deoxychorismate lyase